MNPCPSRPQSSYETPKVGTISILIFCCHLHGTFACDASLSASRTFHIIRTSHRNSLHHRRAITRIKSSLRASSHQSRCGGCDWNPRGLSILEQCHFCLCSSPVWPSHIQGARQIFQAVLENIAVILEWSRVSSTTQFRNRTTLRPTFSYSCGTVPSVLFNNHSH
jgi:hypothetical protein